MKRLPLIVLTILAICPLDWARASGGSPLGSEAEAPLEVTLVCESLGNAAAFAAATTPSGVAAGDFDEDGIADLAVACGTKVSVLIGQGSAGVGDGTYAAPADITVSGTPRHIATGDFNDDGITDLAVPVLGAVAILLGNGSSGVGDGAFGSPVTYAAATNPQRVVTADFNEDGIADLAVTNSVSNSVSVLIGQGADGAGDGSFAAAVNYGTGSSPGFLLAGDFNEDGIADLAIANNSSASNSVSVLIGQGAGAAGDGTFAAAVDYPTTGNNPAGIASGDWNEDGRTDLAVVNGGAATIAILLGSGAGSVGDGTFAAAMTAASSTGGREIASADWSGDGIADLTVTNITNDKVHLFLGGGAGTTGNGTFALSSSDSVGLDPRTIALGDFNEDGSPDVATAKSAGSAAAVLLGGCATALDASILVFASGGSVIPVATEQFINWVKGAAVMAVNVEVSRDGGVNWETIATNVTAGSLKWTVTPPATTQARFRVSDAAVPGRSDVTDADVTICAPFSAATAITAGSEPRSAVAADFNEDGIRDLAIANFASNEVRVILGSGIGGVGNGAFVNDPVCLPVAAGPSDLVSGDFNEDGILDIAVACATANVIEFLRGQGSGGVGNGVFAIDPICAPVAAGPSDLVSGDFNEDGVIDIAVACAGASVIEFLRGQGAGGVGNGVFTIDPICLPVAGPSALVSGDFNEDGIIDLAVASEGASVIEFLRGQGSGGVGNGTFFTDPICVPIVSPASDIVTGDFNADGITDLAVASPAMSTVSILAGLGSVGVGNGSFAIETGPFAIETGPFAIEKGDFNVDGITDLVVAGVGGGPGGQAEILYGGGSEGAGNGSFSCQMQFAIGAGAVEILTGDFLEDNAIDLFVVCSTSGTIVPLLGGCQDPDFGSINVTTPNGGEVVPVGVARTISWTMSEEIDAVDVEVSRDGGSNWETLVSNTTETSFVWSVTGPVSPSARVRVSDYALPNRADASNANFTIATGVAVDGPADDAGAAPSTSAISAPYPNPSAGDVRFALALPHAARATVDVYDASGRLVRRVSDRAFAAGEHVVAWDGRAADGARPPEGVYLLRAQWPGFTATRKVVRVGGNR